ncbi:MAG: polysaccharide pyruvyl transferase family protein [Actinomycetia bacterium]|nr:polysaccharide pyruvyl transferase family protein [Actinomycetes bacterium]
MTDRGEGGVIYLIGTAGHPNYGDELITAGWLRFLARAAPGAEVWLDTPRPGQTAVLMDGLHPGLRCVDTLFHACWNAPTGDPEGILAFGERVVSDPGLIPREASGVQELARVDLIHVLGGGYLNARWPHHLALLGAARGVANLHGARTAITGAGLTPFVDESQQPLSNILADFDVVDVRDEASLNAIRAAVPHATQTGDDAFLTLDDGVYCPSPSNTLLCLQSDLLEVPPEALADYVVRTLQLWGVDQERVTLVEGMPPDDAAIMRLLSPHLPLLELLPFSQLWRQGFPDSPGSRWISTRFHPHLMAAAVGTRGVAVPISSEYYVNKHKSLAALNSGWELAPNLDDPLPLKSVPMHPFKGALPALKKRKAAVAARVAALAPGRAATESISGLDDPRKTRVQSARGRRSTSRIWPSS